MPKQLGSLEQMVMFAVVRLGNESHGLALRREIERVAQRKVSPGALYTTMDRLEAQGLVSSWIGDEIPERGGRRRKFYRLEAAGAQALLDGYEGLSRLADGTLGSLNELLGSAKART